MKKICAQSAPICDPELHNVKRISDASFRLHPTLPLRMKKDFGIADPACRQA